MAQWLIAALIALIAVAAIAVRIGRSREAARSKQIVERLLHSAPEPAGRTVDFAAVDELPAPVARYFRHVLTDGQGLIRTARMRQSGTLRTSIDRVTWSAFSAQHWAVPPAVAFAWDARVDLALATSVRVLDSYTAGVGAGRVSLLAAFPVASPAGSPELDSGALHRYLAEAVWFPTALLPESGVVWNAMDDDHSAVASLTNGDTTVSLEFRFNDVGEVTSVYTPARFGRFGGQYRQAAWEGHFSNYVLRAGMRVPRYGEVGWYDADGALQLVWKGNVLDAQYELGA